MTVIFAPNIAQFGRVEPYISLNEFKYSPTAGAIDFSNLTSNAGQAAQDRALSELITRASSKIDNYCYGKLGTLNATSNTENGRYRMDRMGRFKIHPKYTPVIGASAFEWGSQPGALSPLSLTTLNAWLEDETLVFLPGASGSTTVYYSGTDALSNLMNTGPGGEYYCQWTYINGWNNSFTTAQASAGASSITLLDPTGIYPGNQTTIWDGMNDELVTVSPTYVPGTNVVSLASPLLYTHGIGTNVSGIPAAVKQACIHLVVSMIKQRGQGGVMLDEMGASTMVAGKVEESAEDEIQAFMLLEPYVVISGRL
jgi:hypothetical protein